jgi:hypothetical protein
MPGSPDAQNIAVGARSTAGLFTQNPLLCASSVAQTATSMAYFLVLTRQDSGDTAEQTR